ncbi:MAG: cobalamin B12-binding domain-containing protein [Peptococcaceae bacterium]
MDNKNIKVIMAKPGVDGHWRGAMIVSMALRNAGMEVIYLGNQTPQVIVESALQEDVNVIGLSILAAGHMELVTEVVNLLQEKRVKNILLVVGGTIPREDIPRLKQIGVHEVFPPNSKVEKIIKFIAEHAYNPQIIKTNNKI